MIRNEWYCSHGVGHPKPGEWHHGGGIHGCDGCCADKQAAEQSVTKSDEMTNQNEETI